VTPLPPPRAVLPHGEAALLLTRLVRLDGDTLEAVAELPAASPYAQGRWAAAALVEAAAQAIAAHGALTAAARSPAPRAGYLVGIKHGSLSARVPLAFPLAVTVERTGGAGPLAIYAARVVAADTVLMRAELSVWTPSPETPT
jgi:predicted hotdog family 3-hydroxylacyl-ACP dehydratase